MGSEEVRPEAANGEEEEAGEGEKGGRLFGERRGAATVGGELEEERQEGVDGALEQRGGLRARLDWA